VLVDQGRPHRSMPHAVHQFLGRRATLRAVSMLPP
jgi:hypothetical protein